MSEKSSIGLGTLFLMVAFSVIIEGAQDILDFILIGFLVNPVLDIFATMAFGIWFSHYGISTVSPKNIGPFLGTILADFIPVVNMLPVWTGWVLYMYFKSRIADAIKPAPVRRRSEWRL